MIRSVRTLCILSAILSFACRSAAKQKDRDYGFRIEFSESRDSFHVGEEIRLNLIFTATTPRRYSVYHAVPEDGLLYGHKDEIAVEPVEGVTDPRKEYRSWLSMYPLWFSNYTERLIPIEDKRVKVGIALNDYVRFEKPGKFQIKVVTNRLREEPSGLSIITLTSQPLKLEIVEAAPEWQQALISQVISDLSSKDNSVRVNACRTLEYLDSEESIKALVTAIAHENPLCGFSDLLLSRHKQLALDLLTSEIESPSQPVNNGMITSLAILHSILKSQETPDWSWDSEKRALDGYRRKILESVPDKTPSARTTTLVTMLYEIGHNDDLHRMWMHLMSRFFSYFSPEQQVFLLIHRWREVHDLQDLKSMLEKLYEQNRQIKDSELADLALRRLYDLDSESGRRLVAEEIQDPHTLRGKWILGSFSDEKFPELDSILLDHLKKSLSPQGDSAPYDFGLAAMLVRNYASNSIAGRVQEVYEKSDSGKHCEDGFAELLAFLLDTKPAVGAQLLRKEISSLELDHDGCVQKLFDQLTDIRPSPEYEKVLVDSLKDSNPQIVEVVATALMHEGSPAALSPLWKELDKIDGILVSVPSHLGDSSARAVVMAITRGVGWLPDPSLFARLRSYSNRVITEQASNDEAIWGSRRKLISLSNTDQIPHPKFTLGQYSLTLEELKRKLVQFPKGTEFQWEDRDAIPGRHDCQDVLRYLESIGMRPVAEWCRR